MIPAATRHLVSDPHRRMLLYALTAGATALACLFYLDTTLNHDTSWYLIATRKWLAGASLYRDILEINPPMSFFLTVPAIGIADGFGLEGKTAFVLWTFLLIGLALAWSGSILRRSDGLPATPARIVVTTLWLALVVVPLPAFGQREHLMLALATPLLMLLAFGQNPPRISKGERGLIAVVGAIGLALKPYFLLPVVLLALVELITARRLRVLFKTEFLMIAGVCVGYLVLILLLFPDYLTSVVPVARYVYFAFEVEHAWLVFLAPLLILGSMSVFAWHNRTRFEVGEAVILRLLACAAGFFLAMVIQSKGWFYQQIPFYALAVVMAGAFLTLRPASGGRGALARVFAILFAAAIVQPALSKGPYESRFADDLAARLETVSETPTIFAFTAHVGIGIPAANRLGASWISRYPALWLLPGLAQRQAGLHDMSPEQRHDFDRFLSFARNSTVEDFLAGRPDLVVVDRRESKGYFGGVAFDYVTFFSRDPRFARVWERYEKVGSLHGHEIWVPKESQLNLHALHNEAR